MVSNDNVLELESVGRVKGLNLYFGSDVWKWSIGPPVAFIVASGFVMFALSMYLLLKNHVLLLKKREENEWNWLTLWRLPYIRSGHDGKVLNLPAFVSYLFLYKSA